MLYENLDKSFLLLNSPTNPTAKSSEEVTVHFISFPNITIGNPFIILSMIV